MFFAVMSWNFVGLIGLLFAGSGFKNCSTVLAPQPPYKRKRGLFVCISPVGWEGLVYGAYW